MVDIHVHPASDLIGRYATDFDVARDASEGDMHPVVVKSHVVPTAGRVDQVNRALYEAILYGRSR